VVDEDYCAEWIDEGTCGCPDAGERLEKACAFFNRISPASVWQSVGWLYQTLLLTLLTEETEGSSTNQSLLAQAHGPAFLTVRSSWNRGEGSSTTAETGVCMHDPSERITAVARLHRVG
jgi:hypothetical protein